MIYLDSAATSFYRPPCVAEAVAEAISSMGNCSRGAYKEALTGFFGRMSALAGT